MITNATLIRIDTPGVASPSGDVAYATGATIALRCCLDEPSYAQKFTVGVVVADATAVLYVPLTPGILVDHRDRVSVQLDDGSAAAVYQVLHRTRWLKAGGLSHDEAFLKAL